MNKSTRKKNSSEKKEALLTHDSVPATVGFVKKIRDELREEVLSSEQRLQGEMHGLKSDNHEIKSVMHGIKSEIHEMKSDIHGLKSEIHGIKSEIHEMKADIHQVKSEIHHVKASVHRIEVLMEEQRQENKIVLDGLKTMLDRQDRVEADVADMRETLKSLKSAV